MPAAISAAILSMPTLPHVSFPLLPRLSITCFRINAVLHFFLPAFPTSISFSTRFFLRFPKSANFSIATNNRWWPQVGYN